MKTFERFKRVVGALFVAVLGVAALAGPAQAANRTVNGITIDTNLPAAQRGVPYDYTVAPTGGGGAPYTYQILAGSPPPGITFNTDGRIFGVSCGLNGPYSIDVRVTSATGTVADFAGNPNGFTFALNAGPGTGCDLSVALGSLPSTGLVGTPYTGTVTASGGTTPYTYTIASGLLPTGLTLDAATGVVSGTPTVAGVFNFVLTATDAAGLVGSEAYSITISLGVTVSPETLPDGTFGVAYSQTVSASGGDGPPFTLSLSAGALPDGLTFNAATGVISGTPSQAGSFDFTISATDVGGNVGSRDYTVVIAPVTLDIAPATLPNGTFGVAYSQTITASGGDGGPYTYSVTTGALPDGLTLDGATGAISGNPSLAGSFDFTVTAEDGSGNSGSQAYTVVIDPVVLTLAPATLPDGTFGVAYSQTVTASGGNGSYTYSVSAGSLPDGLSLDAATGAITGTPTLAGSFTFTVSVTDTAGNSGSQEYTVAIAAVELTLAPATLPDGTFGVAYSQTVTASGGNGSYTYSVSAGSLPDGLSLDAATGAITGTPSLVGSFTFTVSVTDTAGNSGSQEYTVAIAAADLTLAPATLPNGTFGVAYSQTVTASGGNGSYTYSVSAGSLPDGLSLDAATGAITGTPTLVDSFTFTISVSDTAGNSGSQAYTLVIDGVTLSISPASLPDGTFGVAYSQTVTASGGNGSYTYSVSAGSLPDGLSLDAATGAITGTPSLVGSFTFTVSVTDTAGNSGSQAYSVAIAGVSLSISPSTLPPASINGPYSQVLTVTGGSGAGYSCVVSAGALPAGITLDSATCTLSGQPTTVGSYSFTITATDSAGNTGSQSYSLEVLDALVLNPATLPDGTWGVAYDQTVSGAGGDGSYSYAVTAGALPNGLSLDGASGAISGTPSLVGSYSFTVTVTDGLGDTASQAYTVEIVGVALTIAPANLPDGEVALAYSQALTVTGGSGSGYSCEVSDGALPAGITLDAASCTLSGTPTTEGAYSFTITATDSGGNTGSQAYSLQIGAALVITITPATLPDGESGEAYSEQLSADGGVAPYTYSVSAGALPAGLTLNGSTGLISGTPTVFGDFSFTVTATDADGRVGSQAYTLTIEGRPDPTRDPELIGMIDGQFGLARRFGEGQIMNVMRHLEGNRSAFRCGLSADLGLSGDNDSRGRNSLDPQDNQARSGVTLGTSGSECDETLPKFGYWVSGSLSDDDYRGQDFTSDALSAGIDFKFSDKLMAGAAVGFGWGESEFGGNGTQSDADATTFMAYLSYNPAGRLYVEAMIGGGDLSIDSDRYVSYDGSMVSGSRNGSLTMGSIGLAGDMIDSDKVLLTGYLRYDMVKIDLDRYEESGATQLALGFGAADQTVNSLVLGGRAAYTLSRSWGLLTPMVRAEYRLRTVGDYRQDMAYLDLPGIEYSLRQGSDNEGSLSLSLGFEALIQGWTLGMEYGSNPLSSSGMSGDMVRATVRYGF